MIKYITMTKRFVTHLNIRFCSTVSALITILEYTDKKDKKYVPNPRYISRKTYIQ